MSERQDDAQHKSVETPADIRPGYGVLRSFDWLEAVAATLDAGKPSKTDKLLRAAMPLAGAGDELTGRGVVVDWRRIAAVLGVSTRTLERYVDDLVELGFLAKSKRAAPDQKAEYVLTGPITFDRRRRDSVGRSSDSAEREGVGRHRRNVRQKPGVTSDNPEGERVVPPQGTKYYPPTPHERQVQQVLDELAAYAGAPLDAERLRGPIADQLEVRTSAQILAGVRARGDLPATGNPSAVIAHRLKTMPAPAPLLPPKCADCDPNRMIETEDGRLTRCKVCHPQIVAESATRR